MGSGLFGGIFTKHTQLNTHLHKQQNLLAAHAFLCVASCQESIIPKKRTQPYPGLAPSAEWRISTLMFVSTRSDGDLKQFDDTLLSALASDGGLYLPAGLPSYSVEKMRELQKLGYCDLASEILPDLPGSGIPRNDLKDLISSAYAEFDHSAIAPLKSMQSGIWLLELFHGPTLAFKDFD